MKTETLKSAAQPPPTIAGAPGERPYSKRQSWVLLGVLMLVYACSQLDRAIVSVVMDPVKREFLLSDTQLGFLSGMAFALFFALAGIPLGLLADRANRRNLIVVCMLFWSGMTALCGGATTYVHLLLARMGVGAGEAGGGPPAMAMIADAFPEKRRATALAFYYLSAPLGIMLALILGGKVVALYGWRVGFFVAGVPGIILAFVLFFAVREPRRGQSDAARHIGDDKAPPFRATISFIGGQKSLLHMGAAITLSAFVTTGILLWMPSFLMRSHGLSMAEAGRIVGFFFGGISTIGILAGGFISDRLGRLDVAWRTRVLALVSLLCAPSLALTLLFTSKIAMIACFSIWAITASFWYGPGYALCQSLVGTRMRATIASMLYLSTNLISTGLGPQVVGLLSDAMSAMQGKQSLRYAMLCLAAVHLWAMLHFLLAGRTVRRDVERAAQA